ncbi:WLM-domain-containing protein [Clavulina sp. PMI_390]|nr:WLM-domain-containing protein [Clavulina sp. PMI_390]
MSEITVTFKGESITLQDIDLAATTLEQLSSKLSELTDVVPAMQKLVWKGKRSANTPASTLIEAGLKPGMKIMLLGSTRPEWDGFKQEESEASRKQHILAQRAASGPSKVRSTSKPSSSTAQYRFQQIEPLPHLPRPEEARKILSKLANDPAIQHVMAEHKFVVKLLTELAPHEHPNLLGLNENSGQAIKLRIRTDAYDGFRSYPDIRRVALHELTHNVWGPHDNNFKELNSQLNREVASYEAAARTGSNILGGETFAQQDYTTEPETTGGSFVLGGARASETPMTLEERRERAVGAAMRRLEEQEKEIEEACASSLSKDSA